MGFSRQEYWSGLPFPSPGDLPSPGIELGFPALQVDSLPSEPPGKSHQPKINIGNKSSQLTFTSLVVLGVTKIVFYHKDMVETCL